METLNFETLKRRIIKVIKAGNNKTTFIIEACNAEMFYSDFCKALAELQIEGKIKHEPNVGYVLVD